MVKVVSTESSRNLDIPFSRGLSCSHLFNLMFDWLLEYDIYVCTTVCCDKSLWVWFYDAQSKSALSLKTALNKLYVTGLKPSFSKK